VAAKQTPKPVNTEWEFEATITTALEISPYDLEVLKRYLLSGKWIPSSTDEAAVTDAVFRLRQLSSHNNYRLYAFPNNKRLSRLFKVWGTEDIEEWESECGRRAPKEDYDLEVQRETTKYTAVRDLFMHMAVSEASKRDKAVKPS
jgi:hypothetical protein